MRRFENIKPELNVSKFWEIDEPQTTHGFHAPDKFWLEVRWGRIGSLKQSMRHHFLSRVEADRFVADKINEKLTRGYIEEKGPKFSVDDYSELAKKLAGEVSDHYLAIGQKKKDLPPPKPVVTGPPAACTHDNLQRWGGGFRCMVCLSGVALRGEKVVAVMAVKAPKPAEDAPRHIELDDD